MPVFQGRATCAGWGQIYRQFGADPAKANETRTVDAFRTKLADHGVGGYGLNVIAAPAAYDDARDLI